MEKKLVCSFILVLFLLSFAAAKISVSEVNQIYNLGDKIYVTVDMVPSSIFGNFEINLNCENESINFYKVPAEPSFVLGEEQKVKTYITLLPESIGNLSGNCYISSSMGAEFAQTKNFIISGSIIVTANLDKIAYDPGETISLEIEAVKANGQPLEGFLEVSGSANLSKAVSAGLASEKFIMPETTDANIYFIEIAVNDRGKGNQILNSGNATLSFKINQIPKFIQTSLDAVEVEPGNNLTVGAELFDQAGKQMPSTIAIRLVSPLNQEIEKTVESGEFAYFDFPFNSTPGKYKVFSLSQGIIDEKEVFVSQIQKVSFDFQENVLIVKNIGNSIYNQTINVTIGDKIEQLELLNIGIGEERKFSLKAPDGEYGVLVSGSGTTTEKNLLLTGDAVSVKEMSGIGLLSKYPYAWIFILIILGAAGIVALLRIKKKTFKVKDMFESRALKPLKEKNAKKEEPFFSVSKKIDEAESSTVLRGEKAKSSIIALKLHNFSDLEDNARQEIEKMLAKAKLRKAAVEWKDDNIIFIFTPLLTKTENNEWAAAKTAYELAQDLKGYNRKFANKIVFGIGVGSGDLIAAVENQKLKYTSLGGTIILAKKLSASRDKILVSEDFRKKLMKDLRVEKAGEINNKQIYELKGISDREANQGKLQDILNRIKE